MRDSTLRAIDRWLGVPGCLVLTLHRRVWERQQPDGRIRRVLFVKLAEQGATVLAGEAIARAEALVGRQNVYFLTLEENRFILDATGAVDADNILTIDASTSWTTARTLWSALRRLRRLDVDAAVGLEFFARASAILTYLSGATRRVGLHSYAGEGPYCGDLHTHRLVYTPYLHIRQLFLVMVEALTQPADRFPAFDFTPPDLPPSLATFVPSAEDRASVDALVRDATGKAAPSPLVLLNANCRDALPLRRWDSDRYAELARRILAADPDAHVLFTGAPVERRDAERLAAEVASPRCASVAGRTTIGELMTLFGLADVLVTNDSGPAHFAALTPVDIVTLFGPETPAVFRAPTPRNRAITAGLVCSPCVNAFNNRLSRCRDNLCMQRITVDEVAAATLEALEARRSAGRVDDRRLP